MLESILFFLAVSLILYAVFGGADFGAGIFELLTPKRLEGRVEALMYRAMGPVWEANHMWIILAVVILFNGFPRAYSEISIVLHLPLTFLLLGIIVRGCAFTFRHYDAFADASTRLYSLAFKYSSLFTSFMMGVIVGAMTKGEFIEAHTPGPSYAEIYWWPWVSPFCLGVGVFVTILFAYQASSFLIAESDDAEIIEHCRRRTRQLLLSAIIVGAGLFILGFVEEVGLFQKFIAHPVSLVAFVFATILVPTIWVLLRAERVWALRFSVAAQMCCVVLACLALQFPNYLRFQSGAQLNLIEAAASPATLKHLLVALVVGSSLIFPALYYLMKVFKAQSPRMASRDSMSK